MIESYKLAIDIGGTFIKYAYVDQYYKITKQWKKPTGNFETTTEFYDYLCEDLKTDEFDCVGVSAPGLIDRNSLVKTKAAKSVSAMFKTVINDEVSKRLNCFTSSINDAKAAGLCELKIGNAQDSKSSGYIIIGTGVGGCICNATDVIYGEDGFAGEIHFIPYYDPKEDKVLKLGNQCSMRKLIQLYNGKVGDSQSVIYGKDVIEKYLSGDEIATQVFDIWMNHLIMDVVNMVVTYNPELICIGGGISSEDWFVEVLENRYRAFALTYFNTDEEFLSTRITTCKYNNSSNLLGAAIKVQMEKEKLINL